MIGIIPTDLRPELFLTPEEDAEARRRLEPCRRPVVIQISSKSSRNKLWPFEKWGQLVASHPECTFFQLGARDEVPIPGVVDLRGQTTLRESFAIVGQAHCCVAIDSSLQHASAALGTAGVVLFGASPANVFGHSTSFNLQSTMPCSPCIAILGSSPCPYNVRCMRNISVCDVSAALQKQLARRTDLMNAHRHH